MHTTSTLARTLPSVDYLFLVHKMMVTLRTVILIIECLWKRAAILPFSHDITLCNAVLPDKEWSLQRLST